MKNKTKFLLTTLFILVAFLLLGTTNVNAETLVTTEEQLRNALSGEDSSITEVKLGDSIEVTDTDLVIWVVNDLTLDLCGNTINGNVSTNQKSIAIQYGKNSLTSGSLTIKDSGSTAGSIKSLNYIAIGNSNDDTSTGKNYSLIIENGQFIVNGGSWADDVFILDKQLANKNVTFNFQVKDGYFEKAKNNGGILALAEEITNDSINLNIKFDKLTFYSNSSINRTLIYSYQNAYTTNLSNVVSNGSKVVLKKTATGATATLTDLDVSATSYTVLHEALSDYNTIEVVKTEGFDVSNVTLNQEYGYTSAEEKTIVIKNRGTNALQIKNVSVSSENFEIIGTTQPVVTAGDIENTAFKIKPKTGLAAGTYTGVITVTDMEDNKHTANVTLTVARKSLGTISVSQSDWTYGDTDIPGYTKSGLDTVTSDKYKIEYSVKGADSWSATKPETAGEYTIRLTITDPNLEARTVEDDFEIKKNNKPIQIIANSNEWTYDGNSHSDTGFKVIYDGTECSGGVLPTGDAFSAVITASVTDVKDNVEANNVFDSWTLENRDCYGTITETKGTIKIKPIETEIVVTADSDTKEYDETVLTKDSFTFTDGVLLAGDILTATITGSQEFVGTSDNVVSDVKVTRGDKDITSNYTFGTHVNGTLKVTAVDQPLSIADQYVSVNNKLFTSELEYALSGAEGNVSFEVKSGTAGNYNDELYGGFLAGSSAGNVVMTAKATAFDVNNDGTPEYNATEIDFTIYVVIKETVTIGGITDNQEFTYDGNTHTPAGEITFSNSSVTTSDLEISYVGTTTNGTAYSSTTAPTNAGTYTVTYKIKDSNANYAGAQVFNFTINKAQLPKVTLKQNSFVYTGENIALEFNNFDSDLMALLWGYGETVPFVKNVKTYDYTVSLRDKNNYEWSDGTTDNIPLTVSVTKANPSYIIPTGLTGIIGQTLEDISLPDGFTWNNAYEALVIGTHTYMATYTPSDTANYNTIENIEITVVTNKKVYEVIEGADQEYTITKDNEAKFRIDAHYGLFLQGGKVYVDDELVNEENYTSEEGSTIITLKQAYVDTLAVGQHTLKVVFADEGEATANFTVAKVVEKPTPDEDSTVDADNDNTNTENKEQDKEENNEENKVENKEEDKSSNPQTFDNIMVYVAIAIMSIVGLGATVIIKKKK